MAKLHPKKELLRKYMRYNQYIHIPSHSEGASEKTIPVKPLPRIGRSIDLSIPNIQLGEISTTTSSPSPNPFPSDIIHYETLSENYHNARLVEKMESEVICSPNNLNYIIPHLPQLEVTRVKEAELSNEHKPPPSNNWVSDNNVCPFVESTTIEQSFFPPSQLREIENQCGIVQPNIQQKPTKNVINNKDTLQNSNSIRKDETKSSRTKKAVPPIRRKTVKSKKPIIPKDLELPLISAGIDERVAMTVLVESGIETFRHFVDVVRCEHSSSLKYPDIDVKMKEVRRKVKNRNAAKVSRDKKMGNQEYLRNKSKQLGKEHETQKHLIRKITKIKIKRLRLQEIYKESLKTSSAWQYHEMELKRSNDDFRGKTLIFD